MLGSVELLECDESYSVNRFASTPVLAATRSMTAGLLKAAATPLDKDAVVNGEAVLDEADSEIVSCEMVGISVVMTVVRDNAAFATPYGLQLPSVITFWQLLIVSCKFFSANACVEPKTSKRYNEQDE